MEHYRFHKATTPPKRAEIISDTVDSSPRTFNMPTISSTNATIHAAQDLIHALQTPEPASPLVTLENAHKEALIYLADIFGKSTSPAVPPRVPVNQAYPDKLKQVIKEKTEL